MGDCRCTLEQKDERAFVWSSHVRQGQVTAVPLGRYFLWVGSVLLAMMFIAGWIWPSVAPAPINEVAAAREPATSANSMMLRIQSARKWPDKIVFDTSIPTIVPPPTLASATVPAAAASASATSPLEARAEMKQAAPPPKRVAKVHRRNARPAGSSWASAYPSNAPSAYPSTWASASPGWSFRW
jgi:hypothetical protein